MAQVLTEPSGARHPSSGHRLLTTGGRTVCRQASRARKVRVLTRQPLPEPSLPANIRHPARTHEKSAFPPRLAAWLRMTATS